MRTICFALVSALFGATVMAADIATRTIDYRDGEIQLRGHLAWDKAKAGKRPGVLVVHEWWGLNDYARKRAEQLAELGYVAFALDMYGADKVTEHPKQAGAWAAQIRENVDAWRRRALVGLELLAKDANCDPQHLAAIGYCFGGATVLQLAYGGAAVDGVVSFHGSLPVPDSDDVKRIKGSLLICHGAADGFVPPDQIVAFQHALDAGKVDWQMNVYAGAKHSFTSPEADSRGIDGLAYNAAADRRSWAAMRAFLTEVFSD